MSKTGNFRETTNTLSGAKEYLLDAEVVSVGKNPLTYINGDGEEKVFYLGNIKFTHPTKGETEVSSQIHQKAMDNGGIEVGAIVTVNMARGEDKQGIARTYFRTIGIAGAGVADADLFDSIEEAVGAEIVVEA